MRRKLFLDYCYCSLTLHVVILYPHLHFWLLSTTLNSAVYGASFTTEKLPAVQQL